MIYIILFLLGWPSAVAVLRRIFCGDWPQWGRRKR